MARGSAPARRARVPLTGDAPVRPRGTTAGGHRRVSPADRLPRKKSAEGARRMEGNLKLHGILPGRKEKLVAPERLAVIEFQREEKTWHLVSGLRSCGGTRA